MDSFLTYVPLISLTVVVGLFVVALVNFSTARKNMQKQTEQNIKNLKIQSEQQIYSRILATEAIRGEGGILLNSKNERWMPGSNFKVRSHLLKWQRKVRFLQSDFQ
jgi:hypothetical protein